MLHPPMHSPTSLSTPPPSSTSLTPALIPILILGLLGSLTPPLYALNLILSPYPAQS